MASYDYLETRNLNRKGVVANVVDDTPVALRIRNIDHAVTSVTIDNTENQLVLIDADGTTTIDFDTATTNTIGEVADTINATTNWDCKILDALRDDAVNDKFVNGAISATTINGVSYYDVKVDTSEFDAFTYRLTASREIPEDPVKTSRRVHLKEIAYYVNGGSDAADSVQVWEVKNGTETQVYSGPFNTDTSETDNFGSGQGYITSAENADLVVRVKEAAFTDGSGNFLRVTGEIE